MQMQIAYRISASDGGQIKGDMHATVHNLGPKFVGEKSAWEKIAPDFVAPEKFANDFGKYRSPLLFADGREVKTKEEWPERRKEIIQQWTDIIGPVPKPIEHPK